MYTSCYQEAGRKCQDLVEGSLVYPHAQFEVPSGPSIGLEAKHIDSVVLELKLRQVRCLMGESGVIKAGMQREARKLCFEVVQSNLALASSCAKAFFYLGSMDLDNARNKGALHSLWRRHSDWADSESFEPESDDTQSVHGEEDINQARNHFLAAASLLGSSTDVFSRNVMRCLALVSGPESPQPISGMSSCALILSSIGRMARQHVLNSIAGTEAGTTDELFRSEIFDAFDGNFNNLTERNQKIERFFYRFGKLVPTGWNFVSPVLCPTGDILVTSIFRDLDILRARTVCIFSPGKAGQAYNEILKPLDEIVQASQDHLQGSTSAVSAYFTEEETKRTWWNERQNIDMRLRELIERVETRFFGLPVVRQLFVGDGKSDAHSRSGSEADSSSDFECGDLASKFEAACRQSDEDSDADRQSADSDSERVDLGKLTVPKLKARLIDLDVPTSKMRKLRKHELLDLLIQESNERNPVEVASPHKATRPSDESQCIFLILDENLHRFPFEGMSFLNGRTVCRVPSLPFALATIRRQQHRETYEAPLVDPTRTSYVLDPENNLSATRNRILPILESLQTQHGWEWDGVLGTQPSVSFFEEGLTRENGLMLYFGHGGGQSCFSRRHVEGMMGKGDLVTVGACCATVILMGCSSGRLTAVNRRYSDTSDELPLFFDPEGIALSYLCAGAPCVVGNLWDVTDGDIDR
jgi:hypothetical protein